MWNKHEIIHTNVKKNPSFIHDISMIVKQVVITDLKRDLKR